MLSLRYYLQECFFFKPHRLFIWLYSIKVTFWTHQCTKLKYFLSFSCAPIQSFAIQPCSVSQFTVRSAPLCYGIFSELLNHDHLSWTVLHNVEYHSVLQHQCHPAVQEKRNARTRHFWQKFRSEQNMWQTPQSVQPCMCYKKISVKLHRSQLYFHTHYWHKKKTATAYFDFIFFLA